MDFRLGTMPMANEPVSHSTSSIFAVTTARSLLLSVLTSFSKPTILLPREVRATRPPDRARQKWLNPKRLSRRRRRRPQRCCRGRFHHQSQFLFSNHARRSFFAIAALYRAIPE